MSPLDGLGHRAILREGFDKDLGKTAAEIDPGRVLRQVIILQRTERDHLGAMFFQQLQVFRVIEVEGVVVGDRHPHRPPSVRFALEHLFGDQRHQFRLVGDPQQQVEVNIAVDRFGEHADHAIPFLVLGHRQQTVLPLRDVQLGHRSQRP